MYRPFEMQTWQGWVQQPAQWFNTATTSSVMTVPMPVSEPAQPKRDDVLGWLDREVESVCKLARAAA